jgi:ribosome recycling factor
MDDGEKQRLQEVQDWLEREFSGIRTGQAAPALLDGIKVDAYGTRLPVPQVGSVGIEDARTLRVVPWEAQMVTTIERAIHDANLGVSVATDSNGLRVIFPELTSERRTQLGKLAKAKLEDARVSVRSIRDETMKRLEKEQKNGDLSEDELHTAKQNVQKLVDETNQALEQLYKKKEDELAQ